MKKKNILYKILKILTVVFACIGVILSGILIGGSINNAINSKEYNTQQIVKQEIQRKDIVFRSNYYLMGSGERSSIEALDSIIYWCNNVNTYYKPFADNSIGASNSMYLNLEQVVHGPYSNIDNIFYISQVGNDGTPTTIFNARRLRFASWVTNQQNCREWIYYLGFGNDGNNEEYGIFWFLFTDITNASQVNDKRNCLFNSYFLRWNNGYQSSVSPLDTVDYAFSFAVGSTLEQMFYSYINDNDSEYNNGFNYGYNQGYENGFYDGQQDLTINGVNPFSLIEQAFASVANVLNIKILPFLSLGTLIFTPIIIGIIIIIVKMVKS